MQTADTTHLDATRTTSVQDAIKRGLVDVFSPARLIIILAIALCIIMLIVRFSWWEFLLIPVGIIASTAYENRAMTRWQIWAYENVADIHQLQRSAELAGLLSRGSHERIDGWMSASQKETLETLQERFHSDAVFVDDPSIPGRTPVYLSGNKYSQTEPVFALNSAGIWTETEGFFEWDIITNERLPQVSYSRMKRSRRYGSAGSEYLFRFDHPNGTFEIPVLALSITVWELDLLLYIYRGRFASNSVPPLSLP